MWTELLSCCVLQSRMCVVKIVALGNIRQQKAIYRLKWRCMLDVICYICSTTLQKSERHAAMSGKELKNFSEYLQARTSRGKRPSRSQCGGDVWGKPHTESWVSFEIFQDRSQYNTQHFYQYLTTYWLLWIVFIVSFQVFICSVFFVPLATLIISLDYKVKFEPLYHYV